jgi:hypothetical protein
MVDGTATRSNDGREYVKQEHAHLLLQDGNHEKYEEIPKSNSVFFVPFVVLSLR